MQQSDAVLLSLRAHDSIMLPIDPIPQLKRQAAARIVELIDGRHAHHVASLMGTDQPRISDLRRGRLGRFSLETLIRFLTRLRQAVSLETRAMPRTRAARAAASEAARLDNEAVPMGG